MHPKKHFVCFVSNDHRPLLPSSSAALPARLQKCTSLVMRQVVDGTSLWHCVSFLPLRAAFALGFIKRCKRSGMWKSRNWRMPWAARKDTNRLSAELDADAPCQLCKHIVRTVVEVQGILTQSECAFLSAAAEERAGEIGWSAEPHTKYTTEDIKMHQLGDQARNLFNTIVVPKLRAQIVEKYCIPKDKDVNVADAFVVRYCMEGQKSLGKHRDESLISATVSLSLGEHYDGGGTCLRGVVHRPEIGGAVLFAGANLHSGLPITAGTRCILSIFFKCPGLDCHHMTDEEFFGAACSFGLI